MITTDEYRALAACIVPKTEVRWYLQGICIDAAGVWAATNGHIVASVETEAPVEGLEQWLAAGLYKSLIVAPWGLPRLKKDRDQPIRIEFDGKRVIAVQGAVRTDLQVIDGTFPDWRRACAWYRSSWKSGTVAYTGFNPAYLAALKADHVKLEFGETANDAIRFQCGAPIPRVRGTLMPVRV